MILKEGLHLAYCTNVHPGETWDQTYDSLNRWTLEVRRQVCSNRPFAIGLRLSAVAAKELSQPATLLAFQQWLDRNSCYVFTINGFPYGRFHGARVKEQVYRPDWGDPLRLEYTTLLFDLLAQLVPRGVEGSVSTLPGSFKEFIEAPEQTRAIRDNLWRCVEHVARLSERTGRCLHLGLEPEPLGLFENSQETVAFFDALRDEHPNNPHLDRHLGVNYDTCHFAIQFEEPQDAIGRLQQHGIRLSKIHISNALEIHPSPTSLEKLATFADDTYLHQVIARHADGSLLRFKDLDVALASPLAAAGRASAQWRVHFHIPLHSTPTEEFDTTAEHVVGVMKLLQNNPQLCSHLEMETYTWAVLPEALKTKTVSEQIVSEYRWTLGHLARHGLAELS